MGFRYVPQDDLYFLITNTGARKLIVAGVEITPGHTTRLAARKLVGLWNRNYDLAYAIDHNLCSVAFNFTKMGYAAVPVTANYILSLQAPTGAPLGLTVPVAAAARPVATAVPEGYGLYNSDTTVPNYSDGAAYKNAAGAPA